MWFAKWFGSRSQDPEQHQDDEPARFSAPQRAETPKVSAFPQSGSSAGTTKPKKGFDPYNSGAFERRNAWERSNLR
jgi:hypothetical protein